MKSFRSLFVIAAMLLPGVVFAGEPLQQAGKWEITTKMDMPGVPFKMPPTTVTQCLTKEDVTDTNKSLPKTSKSDDCKVVDYKIEGNKVTWKVKCKGETDASSTGEMTYKKDSYEGLIKMSSEGQDITMAIKGRRLGDCTK